MAETDAVALRDVRFSYPGASVAALDGLSLELPRTGLILVTGPVGAGASTLLQLLAGLVPHVVPGELSGVARVLGRDVAQRETHRQLAGAVSLLLPTPWVQLSGMAFTVFDETAFGPANLGWRRDVIREAVTAELERLGVSHLTGRDPATLSGGELQRVMLAAALVTRPSILLLDEPAIEIDDAGRGLLCELLCNECVERLVVMATTDVDSFGSLADEVVLLESGRVSDIGSARDVLASERACDAMAATAVARIHHRAGCSRRPVFLEDLRV